MSFDERERTKEENLSKEKVRYNSLKNQENKSTEATGLTCQTIFRTYRSPKITKSRKFCENEYDRRK